MSGIYLCDYTSNLSYNLIQTSNDCINYNNNINIPFIASGTNLYQNKYFNIGFGTNIPKSPLHIHTDSTRTSRIILTNTSTGTNDTDGLQLYKGSSGEGYLWNNENKGLWFGTNNTTRLHISETGNIGINNINTTYKLRVAGTCYIDSSTTINSTANINGTTTINSSLYVNNGSIYIDDGRIISFGNGSDGKLYRSGGQCYIEVDDYLYFRTTGNDCYTRSGQYYGYGFNTLSDNRIKKNLENLNNSNALLKILNLKPKSFTYINNNNNYTDSIGFIAQEIESIIPKAVSYTSGFIPNINTYIEYNDNILTFNLDFDISFLNIGDILLINNENVEILNIDRNFVRIDKTFDKSPVFIYGKKVNDCRNIDKNYIYTLNVCATQELNRKIENLNTIIQQQQIQINNLLSKLNEIDAKLS
jgi:hypothetical protein